MDDREYKIRVMEAEAALKDALAGATVIGATLQTTQTTASVYDASISEIEIRLAKLEKDRQRYQNLVQRNAATPIQLEQIETEYEATRKKLEATKNASKKPLCPESMKYHTAVKVQKPPSNGQPPLLWKWHV